MKDVFALQFDRFDVSPQGTAVVVLAQPNTGRHLRVQVSPVDAQLLAAELAGLATTRTRLHAFIGRLMLHLDGVLMGIHFRRMSGQMVEADAIVQAGAMLHSLPLTFSDGLALALTHSLALSGDNSLEPLLYAPPAEAAQPEMAEVEIEVPALFSTFVNSLPDM